MRLPLNCTVDYFPDFLSSSEAKAIYKELLKTYKINTLKTKIITSHGDRFSDYGKIMFIDEALVTSNAFPEIQWGKSALWSPTMLAVKGKVEQFTGTTFQVCVCIYYPDGNSGVDFHSDYIAFGDTSLIPSLSLGEERLFQLREKQTSNIYELALAEGSLLLMGEHCQERYEHGLPTDPKYKTGRINLTFRRYGF